MSYFNQFLRQPTPAERQQLAADYNEHYDTEDGRTAVKFGDESLNPELKLVQGDQYSRVDYSPAMDRFFWLHGLVLAVKRQFDEYGEPTERVAEYDRGDAACDRYHSRKDCL